MRGQTRSNKQHSFNYCTYPVVPHSLVTNISKDINDTLQLIPGPHNSIRGGDATLGNPPSFQAPSGSATEVLWPLLLQAYAVEDHSCCVAGWFGSSVLIFENIFNMGLLSECNFAGLSFYIDLFIGLLCCLFICFCLSLYLFFCLFVYSLSIYMSIYNSTLLIFQFCFLLYVDNKRKEKKKGIEKLCF